MKNFLLFVLFAGLFFGLSLVFAGEKKSGQFSDGQICKAAIATLNLRDVKIIQILSEKGGIVSMTYARPVDGEVFRYRCKVEERQVLWRDDYMTRWNKNMIILYSVHRDQRLKIRIMSAGEQIDTRYFSAVDF